VNVYLIGDSISLGYTPEVTRLLAGKATVSHNPGNAMYSASGLRSLPGWLAGQQFDLIHFNWGLWDLHRMDASADPLEPSVDKFKPNGVRRTTPEQYAANLEAIVKILHATGAKLIWASSTPLIDHGNLCIKPADVAPYNVVASQVMAGHRIPINDLNAHARLDLLDPDGCHFTDEGYRHLARQVATTIEGALTL